MAVKSKAKTVYVCTQCGCEAPKWQGKCPDCGSWNSFVEETRVTGGSAAKSAAAERRAALTGGLSPEVSGGDAVEAGSLRRAKLSGAACREVSGTDAAGAGTARHTALSGCVSFCFR